MLYQYLIIYDIYFHISRTKLPRTRFLATNFTSKYNYIILYYIIIIIQRTNTL